MKKLRRTCLKLRTNTQIIVILTFLVALIYVLNIRVLKKKISWNFRMYKHGEYYYVKSEGCQIPYLQPFEDKVIQYISFPKYPKCSEKMPLVISTVDSLVIQKNVLGLQKNHMLNCSYQPFWRKIADDNFNDYVEFSNISYYFKKEIKVEDEFVRVICQINNSDIYKDYHSFVPAKKKSVQNFKNREKYEQKVNVLIIGLDAISKANFIRQMPMTSFYIADKLNAIEFQGYSALGDSSFENLIPIFTGLSPEELKETCYHSVLDEYDNCPYMWKEFSKDGYLTAFGENSAHMGLFDTKKIKSVYQSMDYYWTFYNYEAEKEIGHSHISNNNFCFGPRPSFIVLLEYIIKFLKTTKHDNFFAAFWQKRLAFDNINYPSVGDEAYSTFFKYLFESGVLMKTVLIIVSDRGTNFGESSNLQQGSLEKRMPLLYIILPPWFKNRYLRATLNMEDNTMQLVTPFDIHETFKDLLDMTNLKYANLINREKNMNGGKGVSLFLPIDESRTCESSGIPSDWCTCQDNFFVNKNDETVIKVINFTMRYINDIVKTDEKCAPLELTQIMKAHFFKTRDYLGNGLTFNDYVVTFRTNPGGALYESIVRCIHCTDDEDFSLHPKGIKRMNIYGIESSCVSKSEIVPYCYCKKYLNKIFSN